jgi:hypothetical protein
VRLGSVHVDAVRLEYDHADWERRFLAMWRKGSPAHRSYFSRIVAGPPYDRSLAEPSVVMLDDPYLAGAAHG